MTTDIRNILVDKTLISSFSPLEAFRLGRATFNLFLVNECADEMYCKFLNIKKEIFSSLHDIYSNPSKYLLNIKAYNQKGDKSSFTPEIFTLHIKTLIENNKYCYRLAGHKINNLNRTVIIYTILGKREAFQKSLLDLVDKFLINKFHPIEALKLGFISAGEEYFLLTRHKLKI